MKDAVDIFLVAMLLYYVWRLMKASGSLNIFYGILFFIVVASVVSQLLEMKVLGTIANSIVNVGGIALIVIFQEEIRRFLLTLGSQRRLSLFAKMFSKRSTNQVESVHDSIVRIALACDYMSKNKIGALIIIERSMSLSDIITKSETIDAYISTELIKNIFFKNSPLHDGAMVISGSRIAAVGCILPVSHNLNIPKELGLRHRAGLGITQQSDAIAIIVSEETGGISVAQGGEFKLHMEGNELETYLVNALKN